MIRQPAHREQDGGRAINDPLDQIPTDAERLVSHVLSLEPEQIEHHHHRRRGDRIRRRPTHPLEARD
jgi:hypothetical protein